MLIKTMQEIETLREGGAILAVALNRVSLSVEPGISTYELDQIARQVISMAGAEPAFPGYKITQGMPAFPAALCTSVNNEIVHGIPKKVIALKEGDIVGLDLGIHFGGLYTDAATTVPVGKISNDAQRLLNATRLALERGIEEAKVSNTIGDIAYAIETVARKESLGVIEELGGHGVGHEIHEQPFVPNFGQKGTLGKLKEGMVLAIEPMFTLGGPKIKLLDDGWTVVTLDGSLAAHFEHTIVVTRHGCEILTQAQN